MLVTPETFVDVVSELASGSGPIVVDLETQGLRPYHGERLCGIALGELYGDRQYYFPFRQSSGNLPLAWLQTLRELLATRSCWVGHNIKFDLTFLTMDGFEQPESIMDSMLAAHLTNENETSFGLKELGIKYIGPEAAAASNQLMLFLAKLHLKKGDICKLPADLVWEYACQDIVLTRQVMRLYLEQGLPPWRLQSLFHDVCEYNQALLAMELRGLPVDRTVFEQARLELAPELEQAHRDINEAAGFEINLNSPKQICAWLSLPSSDKDTLNNWLDEREEETVQTENVRKLLRFRRLFKLDKTYYKRFLEMTDEYGRLHASFKQHGTVSGRLSGDMQQVPKEKIGRVKDGFVAPPGWLIVEADYSQLEVRIAAHLVDVKSWKKAYDDKLDVYQAAADVNGLGREANKTITLGILFGMWVKSLSRKLGTSFKVATEYYDRYHNSVPELRPYIENIEHKAHVSGYIRFPSGRCRRYNVRWAYPRTAFNNLVQGMGAETTRWAITAMHRDFRTERDPQMVLTIHDSVVFLVREEFLVADCLRIKQHMEHQPWCSVPLTVEVKAGRNWGAMEKLDLQIKEQLAA